MHEHDLRTHEVEDFFETFQIETSPPPPGISEAQRKAIIEANQQKIDDLRNRIKTLASDPPAADNPEIRAS